MTLQDPIEQPGTPEHIDEFQENIFLLAFRYGDKIITDNNPSPSNGLSSLEQLLIHNAVETGEGQIPLQVLKKNFYALVDYYEELLEKINKRNDGGDTLTGLPEPQEDEEEDSLEKDMMAAYGRFIALHDYCPETIQEYIEERSVSLDYLALVKMEGSLTTDNPDARNELSTFHQFVLLVHPVDLLYEKDDEEDEEEEEPVTILFKHIFKREIELRDGYCPSQRRTKGDGEVRENYSSMQDLLSRTQPFQLDI